ncbi:MAG TPA: phosphoribosylaminoimidazolesuccinocarboxamide synthase [Candidatus Paceibacterota bacterium]|nr:phosphoribosylaminoimidazolesuccinocarboxamide synthase [Candidatus Paceibacterota bacterium]
MPASPRGPLIAEGKTKRIYEAPGEPTRAIVEYKNDITAFDNPEFTKQFNKKAEYSNIVNARVFEMLNAAGIPTAFVRQLSPTEFLSEKCTMVPLEVVARRYAVGSYLNRHPEFKQEGDVPHRFEEPVIEYFLKTTKGSLKSAAGETLVEGLDPLKGEEDPFIPNPEDATWNLALSKKPSTDPAASLGRTIDSSKVLPSTDAIAEMTAMIRNTFLTLEAFFAEHDFKFVDFKIEFGVTTDGRLVIADVIDNDSWRLRDKDWKDVSKQSFRNGEDMATIEDKYERVAMLMEKSKK